MSWPNLFNVIQNQKNLDTVCELQQVLSPKDQIDAWIVPTNGNKSQKAKPCPLMQIDIRKHTIQMYKSSIKSTKVNESLFVETYNKQTYSIRTSHSLNIHCVQMLNFLSVYVCRLRIEFIRTYVFYRTLCLLNVILC